MTVRIRLTRNNKKKSPFHKIVVIDSRKKREGEFIEKIGFYNPLATTPSKFTIDMDRANYWISVGAQPSERVAKFIKIEQSKTE